MQVKILSLNLFEGGLFWDNIVALIKRENPDILCLQEAFDADAKQPDNFRSMDRLKALLPGFDFHYSRETFQIWPEGFGDEGNAIFSRFPLSYKRTGFLFGKYTEVSHTPEMTDFSHYPKNMQTAVADFGSGKKLAVCNLHGIWGLDGRDSKLRLEMGRIIVDEIRDRAPLILTGDFNLNPDTETIRNIEKLVVNVFKGEMTSSFNMKHKTNPGYASAVVDMFFATPDVKIISKSVPQDDVSDHVPLVVSIEI